MAKDGFKLASRLFGKVIHSALKPAPKGLLSPKVEAPDLGELVREAILNGDGRALVNLLPTPQHFKRIPLEDNPLIMATELGKYEVVNQLLALGADVNSTDDGGYTPLMAAAREGSLPLVQLLISAGADPKKLTKESANALHYAMPKASPEMVQALFDAGVPINQRDIEGLTPAGWLIRCEDGHPYAYSGEDIYAVKLKLVQLGGE